MFYIRHISFPLGLLIKTKRLFNFISCNITLEREFQLQVRFFLFVLNFLNKPFYFYNHDKEVITEIHCYLEYFLNYILIFFLKKTLVISLNFFSTIHFYIDNIFIDFMIFFFFFLKNH